MILPPAGEKKAAESEDSRGEKIIPIFVRTGELTGHPISEELIVAINLWKEY
jgi:hypothetical protein